MSGLLALALAVFAAPAAATPPGPTSQPIAASPTLKAAMDEHYGAIKEIQLGIIHGLLDHVRERATWLGAHLVVPTLPAVAAQVAAVRAEAAALASTPDLDEAAAGAARLGGACGACHVAAGATTTFPYEPLPRAHRTLSERMLRHRWAAARLWEGLVGPSDARWAEGAATLASAPLIDDPRLARVPEREQLRALARRVKALARRAKGIPADAPNLRVDVYGDLLTTCASCHRLAWPVVRD